MGPSRLVSVPVNLVSCSHLHVQQVSSPQLCSNQTLLSPVITGTVTSLANGPRGTVIVSVSIIKAYKTGRLTITQVGETMSVRLVSQCKKCPLLRRGIAILDTHLHKPQIMNIFIHSKVLINLCGLFYFTLWQVPTTLSWVRWRQKVVEPWSLEHSQPHTKPHTTSY